MSIVTLIEDEGWNIIEQNDNYFVETQYKDQLGLLKLKHPALIHLELYAKHTDPELKYQHMKRGHDFFWPKTEWHYWTERRFRAHCGQDAPNGFWNYITLAAGASASKSYDIAKLAILFWYANPSGRNVTIASVTLASLMTRVWGYVTKHIKEMEIELPYKYYRSAPPRILYEDNDGTARKNKIEDDTLHGIFAVTAQEGDDDQAVATWIGKHPDERILIVLDEATDMPMSILNALPNLNSHPEKFQLIAIGNSNSTMDLHGLLSTPKNGWDSVSPELISWETTQPNGICLYFSPYESPAVVEEDEERRKVLEKFLVGRETLKYKETELGTKSEKFYRWVLGFWKSRGTENVTASEQFLKDFNPTLHVEWSGYYPTMRAAGLDPAFSADGDKCILRIANVGHAMDNKVKIDFNQASMMFEIVLVNDVNESMELQVGRKTIELLRKYNVPLENLAIDCTGQGRAIGEVIKLLNKADGYPLGYGAPMKIYSMSPHNLNKTKKSAPDLIPVSSYELWSGMREYIEQGQVCGLDRLTIQQITNRLIKKTAAGKPTLESKKEYKARMSAIGMAHSPDEADASALVVYLIRKRLLIAPGTTWPVPQGVRISKYEDKMYAFKKEQGVQEGVSGKLPDADFTSGLESSIDNKTPW